MSELSTAFADIFNGQLACYDADLLTIGSTDYPVFGTDLTDRNSSVPGGLLDEPDAAVMVERALIGTFPELQAQVTYRGKVWKIDSIRSAPGDAIVTFDLKVDLIVEIEEPETDAEDIVLDDRGTFPTDDSGQPIIAPPQEQTPLVTDDSGTTAPTDDSGSGIITQ